MISIIAAIGKNNELGKNNGLIWHIPEDLKYFKSVTTGNIIVMGMKTFESIGGPLPNRHNIVITRSKKPIEGVEICNNPNDIIDNYYDNDNKIYIIGGESIYRLFYDYANEMHLTEIDLEDKNADVYFPTFDKNDWNIEEIINNMDKSIPYKTLIYRRKV